MGMQSRSAIWLFVFASLAFSQSPGTITGTVTDPDRAAVSGAQIEARNEKGTAFHAKTSDKGAYTLAQLPAGKYEISIAFGGLVPFSKKDVAVAGGATVRVDAQLADFDSLGALGEDRTFYANTFGSHNAPTGPVPRTPDGKPDFSGVWHSLRFTDPGKPERLPWAEKLVKEREENHGKDAPSGFCLPNGITMSGIFDGGIRIMQNPVVLAFIFEDDLPRQIYLDGRKHPEESLSPFIGHSVGHWEGDTLVVDVTGFNDKTWLDFDGDPQTEKLHVTERWVRKDLGHLEVETTIDDPGAYKKPWTMKRVTELAGEKEEVGQYVCTENNRDVPHLVGK